MMKPRRWTLCLAVLAWISLAGSNLVLAQTSPFFSAISVYYTYEQEAVFQVKYPPSEAVSGLYLSIQPVGESARMVTVPLNATGDISFTYDLKSNPLRPFALTDYWYLATLTDGTTRVSERFSFDYIDNRQTWQSMDSDGIQVNWLEGDVFFGQSALNAAINGEKKAVSLLPGHTIDGLRVYIYASAADLQEALNYAPASWTVGQASPDLGVVVVSITPGSDQLLEMERQIPHEIMHVLLYKSVQTQYSRVPIWLNEGLASITETYPNADYQRALNKAVRDNSLMPLASLCQGFPQDASNAFQAYAESASFVQFIEDKFGTKGLADLVATYKNGLSCEDGVMSATGSSLSQLDYRWRQETLGVDTGLLAIQNLSPYLLVALILLVPPIAIGGVILRRARNQTS